MYTFDGNPTLFALNFISYELQEKKREVSEMLKYISKMSHQRNGSTELTKTFILDIEFLQSAVTVQISFQTLSSHMQLVLFSCSVAFRNFQARIFKKKRVWTDRNRVTNIPQ